MNEIPEAASFGNDKLLPLRLYRVSVYKPFNSLIDRKPYIEVKARTVGDACTWVAEHYEFPWGWTKWTRASVYNGTGFEEVPW